MSKNIDALYAELYPDSPNGKDDTTAKGRQSPRASSFDEEHDAQFTSKHAVAPISKPHAMLAPTTKKASSGTNGFDSDDGEGEPEGGHLGSGACVTSGGCSALHSLNTVPFPNISHPIYDSLHAYFKCSQAFRCFVCSPATSRNKVCGETEAERLRDLFAANNTAAAVAVLAKDAKQHTELLRLKGAYHVVAPRRGNGCCDYTHEHPASDAGGAGGAGRYANESCGAVGGCPFLVCRKCDHPVVRADGVRWFGSATTRRGEAAGRQPVTIDEEAEPETDLYLVVRNYYPDWSRLATAGVSVGATASSPDATISNGAVGRSDKDAGPNEEIRRTVCDFDDDDDDADERPTAQSSGLNVVATKGSPHSPTGNAPMSPTPAEGSGRYALASDPTASAYCCQCSWLTVRNTEVGAAICTTLSDAALYAHVPRDPTHLTKFIALVEEGTPVDFSRYTSAVKKRRLPLWVCKGHVQ